MTEHDESQVFASGERVTEASAFLQHTMAEAKALAVDACVPRELRLELALSLVQLREHMRRITPEVIERMVRLAYGDPGPDQTALIPPEIRAETAASLVERGIVTRVELTTVPKDALIARVRERLAEQGFVDDTGIVG